MWTAAQLHTVQQPAAQHELTWYLPARTQDVQDVLQQHAAVLGQLPADFHPHEVLTTASNLLRVLKVRDRASRSPRKQQRRAVLTGPVVAGLTALPLLQNSTGVAAALASLHTSRPPAVLQLLSYAERVRAEG